MAWYAIRTVPGAQTPQREYLVEDTSGPKGYRVVPSLNPNYSAVELALSRAGYSYYMPAEKRLVRDRRHTDLWKVRRFALMVGYIFVRDIGSESAILDVPGVAGVVKGPSGRPLEIDLADILMVRAAEAAAEVVFDNQTRAARKKLRKNAKVDRRLQHLVDRLDIAGTISMPLDSDVLAA